jgi:uncharacterized protein YdeI (YjbR/CyaY-like superfamily)
MPEARPASQPRHFPTQAAFRRWLEANHGRSTELWVAFHTKASGLGGLAYQEALDEALCFGWIDGVRKKVDPDSYTNRFTPRKRGSTWSLVNVRHAERLSAAGRMRAAGLAAFEARDERRTGVYSFEQRPRRLPPSLERQLRGEPGAWAFWAAQPPGYRRVASWWVVSAKKAETRQRRLATLLADSAAGRRLSVVGGAAAGRRAGRAPPRRGSPR